jgi:hypothetical protein
MQQLQAEQLADAVVALGRRSNGILAQLVGARVYVQIGTSPRDLLTELRAVLAVTQRPAALAQASGQLDRLTEPDPVL